MRFTGQQWQINTMGMLKSRVGRIVVLLYSNIRWKNYSNIRTIRIVSVHYIQGCNLQYAKIFISHPYIVQVQNFLHRVRLVLALLQHFVQYALCHNFHFSLKILYSDTSKKHYLYVLYKQCFLLVSEYKIIKIACLTFGNYGCTQNCQSN